MRKSQRLFDLFNKGTSKNVGWNKILLILVVPLGSVKLQKIERGLMPSLAVYDVSIITNKKSLFNTFLSTIGRYFFILQKIKPQC